jgi:hypothetical protein
MQQLKEYSPAFHYYIYHPKFIFALWALGIFSLTHPACNSWCGSCKFSDMQIACANFICALPSFMCS